MLLYSTTLHACTQIKIIHVNLWDSPSRPRKEPFSRRGHFPWSNSPIGNRNQHDISIGNFGRSYLTAARARRNRPVRFTNMIYVSHSALCQCARRNTQSIRSSRTFHVRGRQKTPRRWIHFDSLSNGCVIVVYANEYLYYAHIHNKLRSATSAAVCSR